MRPPGSHGEPRRRPGSGAHPTRAARRAGTTRSRATTRRSLLPTFGVPPRLRVGRPRATATRAGALLALLGSVGLGYGAVTSSAFALAGTDVGALRWTDRAEVLAAVAPAEGGNAFRVETGVLEARIRDLPAVASVRVRVALPDRLVVEVTERTPILAWQVGDSRLLIDRTGRIFASPSAETVAAVGVPTVVDTRASSAALAIGGSLDPEDLDAATRLAGLTPRDIGSLARSLVVVVTDENGFVVRTQPASWTAIFGFYTPSVRTPELIPGQVRLLRSLLDEREPLVDRVILADDRNGTWVPKPTATPAP